MRKKVETICQLWNWLTERQIPANWRQRMRKNEFERERKRV